MGGNSILTARSSSMKFLPSVSRRPSYAPSAPAQRIGRFLHRRGRFLRARRKAVPGAKVHSRGLLPSCRSPAGIASEAWSLRRDTLRRPATRHGSALLGRILRGSRCQAVRTSPQFPAQQQESPPDRTYPVSERRRRSRRCKEKPFFGVAVQGLPPAPAA